MKNTLILITFISFTCVGAVNYCTLHCKDPFGSKIENTACKCSVDKNQCGSSPQLLQPEGDMKDYIAALHNEYREKFAEGTKFKRAADIIALAYDDNLAHTAQCWTNKCVMGHDKCRRTEQFVHVGQNFFWGSSKDCGSKEMLKIALQGWYDEINDATVSCLESYDGCSGHFTQMVWSKTTHVGCGRIIWSKGCSIICNYGPAGNMLSAPVYDHGAQTCETDPKYPHLCKAKDPIVNPNNPTAGGKRLLANGIHFFFAFFIVYAFTCAKLCENVIITLYDR